MLNWSYNMSLESAEVARLQQPGHVAWVILCTLGFIISLFQIVLILTWKPLRSLSHSLIFAGALSDLLKSLSVGMVAIRRLYLVANGQGEITSQFRCLCWISGNLFSIDYALTTLLSLSLDRLIGVWFPTWYREQQNWLKVIFLLTSALVPFVSTVCAVIDSSDQIPNVACTVNQSPSEPFLMFESIFQNSTLALVLFSSVMTAAIVFKRYRLVRQQRKDLRAFKRDVELTALKTLAAISALFLISYFIAGVLLSYSRNANWTAAEKAAFMPTLGILNLIRGIFDCPIYILFIKEYQNACCALFGLKQLSVISTISNRVKTNIKVISVISVEKV